MPQDDQLGNVVNHLTTTGNSGPPQLHSMSDLLALTGPTSQPGSGGGPGGKFDFNPDELNDLITKWQRLYDDLSNDHEIAQAMTKVTPPAAEDASSAFADTANASGFSYLRANEQMQNYVKNYIKKLNDALKSYTNAEQANADHARRV